MTQESVQRQIFEMWDAISLLDGAEASQAIEKGYKVERQLWENYKMYQRIQAGEVWLKHNAENMEKNLGLSTMEVIVNAMIEFKNTK